LRKLYRGKWKSLQVPSRKKPAFESIDWDKVDMADLDSDLEDEDENENKPVDMMQKYLDSLNPEVKERERKKEEEKLMKKQKREKHKTKGPWDDWIALNWMDWFTLGIIILQVLVCPFTKVEESFPLQAIHDFIYHPTDLASFDHNVFPGVVPRTFLGSLAVAIVASPFALFLRAFDLPKVFALYLVRIVLGVMGGIALRSFRVEVRKKFGKEVETAFTIIACSQFHFLFYISRTLPNVFALCLVLVGYRFWMQEQWTKTIALFAFTASVFRSELVVLFAPMALEGLLKRQYTIKQALISGILASVASIGLSVAVDSLLWGRPLWPEGEVFWYNAVQNKSHNWGTSPFHWYFTSALPRALLGSTVLIPVGFALDHRVRSIALVAFAFVALYSYLPHKELRFVIYSVPLWNLISAVGLVRLYHNFNKGRLYQLAAIGAVGLLFLSVVASSGFLYVSANNYPAGHALKLLHKIQGNQPGYVHIDTYCAMSGVSRFVEERESRRWRYSKQEDLPPHEYAAFDYLLVGVDDLARMKQNHSYAGVFDRFEEIALVDGYDGIEKSFPPHVRLAPKVAILKKNDTKKSDQPAAGTDRTTNDEAATAA